MLGRDDADPLILQLKEAAASDILLGCVRFTAADGVSRDFYMRQLWDGKGSALVELMDPTVMEVYAELCAQALAKAHARSGDAVAIAGYLGSGESFDRAMASFAELYADQNERDYDAVRAAVASGRVAAQTDL
jgi:predicted alpha/beta hydrolase